MTSIWSFRAFDYVWLLTGGGPAVSSETLSTYLFIQAFQRFEAGYGSAIGLTITFFAGIILILVAILRRQGVEI